MVRARGFAQGSGFTGLGIRAWGLRIRVQGPGLMVQDFGFGFRA